MPSLDWIGKRAVVNHHREVPTRLLQCDGKLSYGDPDAGNLLVQGDNLEALKALLPFYAGEVKCIYIDPPYNTGKEGWKYDDKVNSPEIAAWLGKTVGEEATDLSRHDKWLCMMYPRVRLLKEFLRNDGVLFVSCDDNEQAALHLLLCEIFGRQNFIGTAIWKNATDNNPTRIAVEHEYVVAFAKSIDSLPSKWSGPENDTKDLMLSKFEEIKSEYQSTPERARAFRAFVKEHAKSLGDLARYKLVDDRGVYVSRRNLENPGKNGYDYEIVHPITKRHCAKPLWGWRFPLDRMTDLLRENRIVFGKDEKKIPELKAYLEEVTFPFRSVFNIDSRKGSNDLEKIFGRRDIFKNPKSVEFVEYLLSFVSNGDDLILDSFAGSGTTAHAVLRMNSQDGKRRRFVTIEMDPSTAAEINMARLRLVSEGYQSPGKVGGFTDGLGSGARYCTLGKPIFDEWGAVNEGVKFADLAAFVFFSDTGSPIPKKASAKTPLLGTFQDRAIYMLFSPETLGVADELAGNVLTLSMLDSLPWPAPGWSGSRVVYAEGCTVPPDRLAAAGVTFKQVPYQLAAS